jgi:hypothetical protein|tara:strand:+ start:498 stop:851 length:354 start_codon:yes stop_codon:yes gene_type:complete
MALMHPMYNHQGKSRKFKRKKSQSLLAAEKKHTAWLKSRGLDKIPKRKPQVMVTVVAEDVRRNVQEQKSLSSGRTPSYYGGFKKEVFKTTKTYTIAPAYNKGAYQVISREEVKNIGK